MSSLSVILWITSERITADVEDTQERVILPGGKSTEFSSFLICTFSDFVEEGKFTSENLAAAIQSRIILEGPEDYLLNSSGTYTPTSGLKYIIECVERLDQINLSQQVRVLSEKVLGNELGDILMKGRG